MNTRLISGGFERLRYKLDLYTRLLDSKTSVHSFADRGAHDAIQRIYVINLDRKPNRWHQVIREIGRFRGRSGVPLSSITRRFSAIDARNLEERYPESKILHPHYSLADQLLVEPNPRLRIDGQSRAQRIEMTPQEVAVALSHIEVWKLIADSDVPYTLILEDDVYFPYGFCRNLDAAWVALTQRASDNATFDLLYLSFKEVENDVDSKKRPTGLVRRPHVGIWQASGYVLSQVGARKLLELLPVHGPIDLWLNLQFDKLNVLTTKCPLIEQRIDVPSTNSYSIMPVLSQVGVHTNEKPLIVQVQKLAGPVFAFGEPGSGLTALATALSMLGYTCCSDICEMPAQEQSSLLTKGRERCFNAYVNIGSLCDQSLSNLAKLYPNARFILTTHSKDKPHPLTIAPSRILYLPEKCQDKWSLLSAFLEREYPSFSYPICNDVGQRGLSKLNHDDRGELPFEQLKFDSSPWILSSKRWSGMAIVEKDQKGDSKAESILVPSGASFLDESQWKLRDDTFPSNLALFSPHNFTTIPSEIMRLTLRSEITTVRSLTSAAIASRQKFLYGTFAAELRPPCVSGLITGMFLHRNGPRQEIDIEFLGKDTTKMLINVYYNPGVEGTKLEYGYRGTPTLIDLGFDASKEFHRYEIEWRPHTILWRVDGEVVYERVLWNPTPIPNLPMEFNINLWHSRSKELGGKLDAQRIPAHAEIRSIQITHTNKK